MPRPAGIPPYKQRKQQRTGNAETNPSSRRSPELVCITPARTALMNWQETLVILWNYLAIPIPPGRRIQGLRRQRSDRVVGGSTCLKLGMPQWMTSKPAPIAAAKQNLTSALYVTALLGLKTYWDLVFLAWDATKPQRRPSFFTGTPTHPWFQWRNPMDHLGNSVMEAVGFSEAISGSMRSRSTCYFRRHLWRSGL